MPSDFSPRNRVQRILWREEKSENPYIRGLAEQRAWVECMTQRLAMTEEDQHWGWGLEGMMYIQFEVEVSERLDCEWKTTHRGG